MDKKHKDSAIRATVDRAALLRGVLMLTALALLLFFGLKPSRAAAPDAEGGEKKPRSGNNSRRRYHRRKPKTPGAPDAQG